MDRIVKRYMDKILIKLIAHKVNALPLPKVQQQLPIASVLIMLLG